MTSTTAWPTLAGIALSAETVTSMLDTSAVPTKISQRLDAIRTQAQASASDVRRLV